MRVISGKARSLKLKTLDGNSTRPTTDRIKETLFNIINPYLYDCNFLDLFSGSGGIGIEALSRGAGSCTFVENNPAAVNCINENLRHTKLSDNATVVRSDFLVFLNKIKETSHIFDIIFMDPPYDNGFEKNALAALSGARVINSSTLIIVECSLQTDFSYVNEFGFTIEKRKEYKTNAHVFIRVTGD